MDTSLVVRNMRRQSWALMLKEQSASGLTVREWCRQNHLSVKSFYYRRRQVQEMILDATEEPSFAELVLPEPEPSGLKQESSGSVSSCFVPQLTISARDLMVGVTQETPRQLIADVLEVIRNA